MFQLRERAQSPPDELSGGMRRRLLIAGALIHGPSVLVLDELTTGLGPQTGLPVWEKLALLKSQGTMILLTTHSMEEAAHLCDRLVVMDNGSILVEGNPKQLIADRVGERVLEVKGHPVREGVVDERPKQAGSGLRSQRGLTVILRRLRYSPGPTSDTGNGAGPGLVAGEFSIWMPAWLTKVTAYMLVAVWAASILMRRRLIK